MIEDLQDAVAPLTDREQDTVYTPTDLWTDSFALKVAVQDFERAEQYRTANHDWRWRTANELYQAWVTQKYWEGTKIPRASIGVFVAFEQVESMLPKILGAIFSDNPWFHADPEGQTTAAQARQWQAEILAQLDKARVREIYRRSIKSSLIYGNGITHLSWVIRKVEKVEWLPKMEQIIKNGRIAGYKRVIDKQKVKILENHPVLEWIPLEDFYIDPNCFSPQVTDAAYTVRRKLVYVEDLAALRDNSEFQIPDDDTLLEWSRSKVSTQGDSTKSSAEIFRLGSWYPQMDQTVDPGRQTVEILEYETDSRIVWVGNRQKAILNIPNAYGFKTYYDTFYADVPGRFYAMGVCDVVEGEQRLQAALLNGRLDELALSLHRPMMKKLGIKLPQYALRVKPGQIWEVEDPQKDVQFMDVPNITANAYVEAQASEMRVQKNTGQADLYATGTPSAGGNSASRTATGIGAQVQASSSRVTYIVENIEDTFIEPMLNDIVKLNQMFPPIGTSAADTIAMSKVQLSMRASAKMQSRMALMQTFPLVFQALTNPGFVSELGSQGVTIDWKELMNVLVDMTGYRNRADLIRPLSPQEQQKLNQPPPQDVLHKQMQDARLQSQEKTTQAKLSAADMQTKLKLLMQGKLEREKQTSTDQTDDNAVLMDMAKALIAHATKLSEPKGASE